MALQFTPPKTPNMLQMIRGGAQPQAEATSLPLPYPEVASAAGTPSPAPTSPAVTIPSGPQGPPLPTAPPPESAALTSQLQKLNAPPTTRDALIRAVEAFAPAAIAGAVGGLPAAAGAAQGTAVAFAQEAAQKQEQEKSLISQVEAARGREQQYSEFGQTLQENKAKLAQEGDIARSLEAGRNTRNESTILAAGQRNAATIAGENARKPIDILSPEGQKTHLAQIIAESQVAQRPQGLQQPSPPMSPGLYDQRKGLAQISADTKAAGEAAKAGNDERLAGVPTALHSKIYADVQKAEDAHTTAQAASDTINTFINLAKSGNREAYAYSPVAGVLEINTGAGVKRINRQEIDAYAGAGSLFDRIQAAVGKQASGASLSPQLLADMQALHSALASNTDTAYQRALESIDKTYRSHFAGGGAPGGKAGTVVDPAGVEHQVTDVEAAIKLHPGTRRK